MTYPVQGSGDAGATMGSYAAMNYPGMTATDIAARVTAFVRYPDTLHIGGNLVMNVSAAPILYLDSAAAVQCSPGSFDVTFVLR